MKAIRNVAFLTFVAAFIASRGQLFARITDPLYPACETGCTCTIDPENWLHVTVDCPDVANVDECPYAEEAFWQYCELTLPMALGGQPSCWVDSFEGCTPLGFEPPTYIEGYCLCWYPGAGK
jgi:hypothetical protein